MKSISIENVMLDGKSTCVRIEGNRFARIGYTRCRENTFVVFSF